MSDARLVKAVGAVVLDGVGRILLVQRGDQPQAGRWTLPGGKTEPGETLREALVREVREETGLDVEVGGELGILRSPTADGRTFEIHDFSARIVSGAAAGNQVPVAADDAADARWVRLDELDRLETTDGLVDYLTIFGVLPPSPLS